MGVSSKFKLGRVIEFPNSDAAQVAYGSGNRATVAEVTAVSSGEVAVPNNARVVFVRATDSVWIRFGAESGVGAAAADDDSILFPAGESVVAVPLDTNNNPFTHFRVMAAGDNCSVQLESIPHST